MEEIRSSMAIGRGEVPRRGQACGLLRGGYQEVVDGDLSNYFGEIPHAELMKSIARRVSDRILIKMAGDAGGGGRREGLSEISTCGASCWDGRCWVMPGASVRKSSIIQRMTSVYSARRHEMGGQADHGGSEATGQRALGTDGVSGISGRNYAPRGKEPTRLDPTRRASKASAARSASGRRRGTGCCFEDRW